MTGATSPFLSIPLTAWVASNALAFAIRDRYPVTPGHTLVITKRVVATWFEASRDEQLAILDLVLNDGGLSARSPDVFVVGDPMGVAPDAEARGWADTRWMGGPANQE